MDLHLYFFHKNFRQITMASYFYLVKATVQKNCLVSTSKIVENKDIFVMNTNYNFLSVVLFLSLHIIIFIMPCHRSF